MGAAMEATIVATMGAAMAIVAAMGANSIMVMPMVVPTGGLRAAMDAGKGLSAATSGERARVAFHTTLQPSDGQQRVDRSQLGARGKSSTATECKPTNSAHGNSSNEPAEAHFPVWRLGNRLAACL